MSRLIDADNFRRFAHEQLEGEKTYSIDEILEMIDEQPTAYDVEKVVSEIKRYSGNGYRDIDGDYVPPMIETKDTIDIVKRGGVG